MQNPNLHVQTTITHSPLPSSQCCQMRSLGCPLLLRQHRHLVRILTPQLIVPRVRVVARLTGGGEVDDSRRACDHRQANSETRKRNICYVQGADRRCRRCRALQRDAEPATARSTAGRLQPQQGAWVQQTPHLAACVPQSRRPAPPPLRCQRCLAIW